jgi:hypothetical protein
MSSELNETQNASVGMLVGMIEVCAWAKPTGAVARSTVCTRTALTALTALYGLYCMDSLDATHTREADL